MANSNDVSIISHYLSGIQAVLNSGDAREHAYRPAFQKLIEELMPEIQVINEPAYTGGNAPDFLFKKGETPIAYAECKDVTVDIKHKDVQKQALRYVEAFGRILLTNYYDFQIIDETGKIADISIAEMKDGVIQPNAEVLEKFVNLIRDYITPSHRTIQSAKKLAEIMASKARLLRDNALASLSENQASDIYAQFKTFKEVLINDLSEQEFADMYAQTLVYGLFVARYFDKTLTNFSRHEAQDLLPSTNPLLKKFFGHVAGTDYDPKIAWMVDSLIEAYKGADVHAIMHKEFATKQKDPVLHFYETFLTKYDEGLRKSRGVYYTPEPVVSFIVRSVDQILKSKFGLVKGLADTSKIDHTFKIQGDDARTKDGVKQATKQIHKVQILDPAVGTGTFLNEVIHEIYRSFKGQEGMWPTYAKEHLLPRLHGFELMMASYTMAHLKLGVTLAELGYQGTERLSVWLTNSLEDGVHEVPNLFMSQWLTEESNQASKIKSEMPIMVVLGNPPYSVSSSNKGEGIQELIKVYKQDLNEKNIQPLSDDYIKFIRFAENQVEKTGYGIVAMITNNSFLDGVIHRQMRKHLMETFDEIYILDLHGNSKKKETALDGGKDENVFSIQQGVSINLFIKTGNSKELAKVYHSEMYGKQAVKYKELNEKSFESLDWKNLELSEPYYFFSPKDFELKKGYNTGFKSEDLFNISSIGITTERDNLLIQFQEDKLKEIADNIISLDEKDFRSKFTPKPDGRDWKISYAKKDLQENKWLFCDILYRPFDSRKTIYTGKTKGIMAYPRNEVMQHLLKDNIALILTRQFAGGKHFVVFCTNKLTERSSQPFAPNQIFPLYFYSENNIKIPNLNSEILKKVELKLGLTFSPEGMENSFKQLGELETPPVLKSKETHFSPEDILDYIYAVLHSPSYREKYKEFLKIDFPRVPYPDNKEIFWQLVELGRELRGLHLLESSKVTEFITTFPVGGSNTVEKGYPKYKDGNVYINETQYFGNVPEVAWDFYIGGYQPAQKWLKDRRERTLSMEDIEHYQKVVVALSETERVMKEVDEAIKF